LFCGGVSRNPAVVGHIADLLKVPVTVDEYSHLYGAIGAALNLMEVPGRQRLAWLCHGIEATDWLKPSQQRPLSGSPPLTLQQSLYPDFTRHQRTEFVSALFPAVPPVEVDAYRPLMEPGSGRVFLGLDIGSTSTKAVLLGEDGEVTAGFYTRTAGRPVEAVQSVFHAIDDLAVRSGMALTFLGVGTTGSGRKFIGEIIGADVVLDEITAHARAAVALDPAVDTIIEIGGQDSKFTTLRDGNVTFSCMNTVCAAGTGSFIEEQARKLNCPLDDYAARAEGVSAPVSSDKCTVFMERDLNYYLNVGYGVEEVLASVLHSVRDNYLTKVASENLIGRRVCFQGATAKNRALVAAFEQKLKRPIHVSRYCHLTGALGIALQLREAIDRPSRFRGIGLYRQRIPVETEICELCTNHCKIKTAVVDDQTVAFGFLCGRDYQTSHYVLENRSGFDLLKARRRVFAFKPADKPTDAVTVGLPAALYLFDELPLWQRFFDRLGVRVVISRSHPDRIKEGKKLSGAEFCAPMTALHGHVADLVGRADFIFLPEYLEARRGKNEGHRQYCYYAQYAPAIISQLDIPGLEAKLINPVVRSMKGELFTKIQLYRSLKPVLSQLGFFQVSTAYDEAVDAQRSALDRLKEMMQTELTKTSDDIGVVLLGRPYTVLSPAMNGRIPELFDKLGIKVFFQDMLQYSPQAVGDITTLLQTVHWHFAARILEAAEAVARNDQLYPVLVTSFKCTPDAFVVDIFKDLMAAHGKPYLILQLDEHDSSVGYETRIEAGIRSFRNHHRDNYRAVGERPFRFEPMFLKGRDALLGKTLLLPNFDEMPGRLLEAALQSDGIDARLLDEREDLIRRSVRFNLGQCLPINVMVESCIDFIRRHDLNPAQTAIWSIESNISCNLGVIGHLMKKILTAYGHGMEDVSIYAGEVTYLDISLKTTINAYLAYMFGGYLKKLGCRLRPYEKISGATDQVIAEAMSLLYSAFLNDKPKEPVLAAVIRMFEQIEIARTERPQVAIFGDLYARDNDVFNQDLIRTIEAHGGEVITTPYNEYLQTIAEPIIRKWFREGRYSSATTAQLLRKTLPLLERRYQALFQRVLREPPRQEGISAEAALAQFNIKMMHIGESQETILKIFNLIANHPDIALFVQTSPALCCPSLVTQAMSDRIEKLTGIPVVSIEYDGTGGFKNDAVIPYLRYPRKRRSPAKAIQTGQRPA
jgi:predicted CoA-substrate-specific enzyme activase